MAKWEQIGKSIHGGEKTIVYAKEGCPNTIESRKRAIPHANGSGYWYSTTYWVISPDGKEKEYYHLYMAKTMAERGTDDADIQSS